MTFPKTRIRYRSALWFHRLSLARPKLQMLIHYGCEKGATKTLKICGRVTLRQALASPSRRRSCCAVAPPTVRFLQLPPQSPLEWPWQRQSISDCQPAFSPARPPLDGKAVHQLGPSGFAFRAALALQIEDTHRLARQAAYDDQHWRGRATPGPSRTRELLSLSR